ncbi:hypothetical protein ACJJTC_000941 [Scirpophaga incertulas]
MLNSSSMSRNIVFEGWLTKSPPSKRIWRTKWRRRWFALRQSGELPGQYFLDYYADRNYRRLKGTINLDLCEQVDAGLHMERIGNGSLDHKLRRSVFTIQTQSRIYHLEADCEADMALWVDAICRVCGLRATDDADDFGPYENNANTANISTISYNHEITDGTGPYIPISECITGVRAQNSQRAFTFDPKNIVSSTRTLEKMAENRGRQMYLSQPQMRLTTPDSGNDSAVSDEDSKSLSNSQHNIRDYAVSFTKLNINANTNGPTDDGPPVPPRPPKTLRREVLRDIYQGPKIVEPGDIIEPPQGFGNMSPQQSSQSAAQSTYQDTAQSTSRGAVNTALDGASHIDQGTSNSMAPSLSASALAPKSPVRQHVVPKVITINEEEENCVYASLHYYNLPSLPPIVDRNLKPRPASHNITPSVDLCGQNTASISPRPEIRADALQYLDLDLPVHSSPKKNKDGTFRNIIHGRSDSYNEIESAYRTVDFVKTEAFNITRQDAEASRNMQY